ncbi:MAG TPA: HAD family hydrolase [Blastocatellia bacterium]|nr:HAD family hydrolase [Blastocatellia bacterium]
MGKNSLVVSDIDGTLITSNHEVTEATRRTALRIQDAGIALSLASSRPPRSIRPIAEILGLRSPFASFNGALISRADGEVVTRSTLKVGITAEVKAIADEFSLSVWLYDELDWWAPWRDAFVDREEHTSGFGPSIEGYSERLTRECSKLTVVGNPDMVAKARERVLVELGSEVSASCSKPRFLDVTAYGMHKGTVIIRLAEVFKIPPSRVAVIGDGPNDIEMFRQAGTSIAMGQAVDEVRASATYVTASNDNEGWSKGLEEYVLNEENPQTTVESHG